jgi:hypothetical protein
MKPTYPQHSLHQQQRLEMTKKASTNPKIAAKANNLNAKVKVLLKEELHRQLIAPYTPRMAGKTITEAQVAPFGAWVKRQFNGRGLISESVKDADVLQFLLANPGAVRLSPKQLVEMFNVIPKVRAGLGHIDESDLPEKEDSGTKKNVVGEQTMTVIGEDEEVKLGKKPLTSAWIKNIETKAKGLLATGVGDLSEMTPEELNTLTEKFDDVVETAALKFTALLKTADGNLDKLLPVLAKVSQIPTNTLRDGEIVALQYLVDLAAVDGNDTKVYDLLVKDINRNDPKGNILKTFQNVVAQVFNPEVRRARGRPLGSKNKS